MKRWKLFAAILALCVGVTGSIWAQDHDRDDKDRRDNDRVTQRDHERDHDRDDRGTARDRDRDDQNAYRQRNDRDHDDGYYRQRNDRDRDDGYYGRGGYGAYGPYSNRGYSNLAYQTGYRDGMIDGQHDFQSRRNYQPERDNNYKHADRGYNSGLGDKNAYKQDYRGGYLEGYRAAYGRGGY